MHAQLRVCLKELEVVWMVQAEARSRPLSLKPTRFKFYWGPGALLAPPSPCESLSLCPFREAVEFLRKLASLSGGRYHCPVSDDTLRGIQYLLTRGFFEEKVGHQSLR